MSIVSAIKDIFNLGDKSVIGVDIGLSQIKVCEMKKSGSSFKLMGYASADLPESAFIDDDGKQYFRGIEPCCSHSIPSSGS